MKSLIFKSIIILVIFPALVYSCKGKDKKELKTPMEPPGIKTESSQINQERSPDKKTNSRPRIESIEVVPSYPKLGDVVKASVIGKDEDEDDITFRYRWSKNGKVISETDTIDISDDIFKRGDEIVLQVIPYDGIENGDPAYVHLIINNSPPEITSSPQEIKIEKKNLIYRIRAVDKDGDKLFYKLINSPPGMTIDEDTGLVRWIVPLQFHGRISVDISVTDGNGGEAFQRFELNIGS